MKDLKLESLLIILFIHVISFFLLTAVYFLIMYFLNLLILISNIKFRKFIISLFKYIFVWLFILTLLGISRFIGGVHKNIIIFESLNTIKLIFFVLFIGSLLFTFLIPKDYLCLFDKIKIPRYMTYIFLSVITIGFYLRLIGHNQIELLKLKNLYSGNFYNKMKLYYRILAPLFSVTLKRQFIHAQSLEYRDYFSTRLESQNYSFSININDFIIIIYFILNLAIFFILS